MTSSRTFIKGVFMNLVRRVGLAALVVSAGAAPGLAQESGIQLRSVRVLAADPEEAATFYEKAFGMSETRRPVNSATFKEIVINSGSTAEIAKRATSTPLVIATRPKDAVAPAMAAVIFNVPDMDRAINAVKAAGGSVVRPASKSGADLTFAMVKDPDGNQIELVLQQK
jgi:predicted enzyme related to lactoylglutathione lyase